MYITNKTIKYPCTGYFPTANDARFKGVEGLTLTNVPEPAEPTVEQLLAAARAAALDRIDGKCEVAIVADLTVEGVAYPMTRGTAQDDLARAVARAIE